MIIKLAWKNLWLKPLNTILSFILLASSVAIITVLILLQNQFDKKFYDSIENIDLVLGAQGSPLQVLLSSVYQMDAPTGNIDYDEAKKWMANPFVKEAIPLAFGDNFHGYKILGTTPQYIEKYGGTLLEGTMFKKPLEVVIGSTIASNFKLAVGDTFLGSHGAVEHGEVHENHPYRIVGILKPTDRILDNLVVSNIESVWTVHDHASDDAPVDHATEVHDHQDGEHHNHDHKDEVAEVHNPEDGKEITAVLISFRNKMGLITWPRIIAQNTKMQAVLPAVEINRLISMFGVGIESLKYLAYGIMLLSGISIFVILYNRLKERKYEFALIRIHGGTSRQLLQLVVIESLLLCLIGFIFGTIIGRFCLGFISLAAQEEYKMSFNPLEVVWKNETTLFILTLCIGLLSAVIPALKAYSMNISKTLANA